MSVMSVMATASNFATFDQLDLDQIQGSIGGNTYRDNMHLAAKGIRKRKRERHTLAYRKKRRQIQMSRRSENRKPKLCRLVEIRHITYNSTLFHGLDSVCRYRDGPLPDIQIPPASLVAPLVSLIGSEKDGPVSQSIFCDALVSVGADRSALLIPTLQDVLREASRQSNGPLVKTLLRVRV